MRDQHRDKRELITELTDLRKQVTDLKQAAAERRRVEEGIRRDRDLLRALLDQSPHPLCLMTTSGAPLLANAPFAELLGYASPGELVRLGGALGVLAVSDAWSADRVPDTPRDLAFRRRDGGSLILPALAAPVPGTEQVAVAIASSAQAA